MITRRYSVWGAWAALVIPLLMLVASIIWLMVSYDGKCGGYLPEISAAKPCTLAAYVVGWVSLLALIAIGEYWPFIIVLLVLPIGIGLLLDRRRASRAANPKIEGHR
jgi:hypothetical protein